MRILALTTGMLLAMALGGAQATARGVDSRMLGAEHGATPAHLSSVAGDMLADVRRFDEPVAWIAPPSKHEGPTAAVWRAEPRRADTSVPESAVAGLLIASAVAFMVVFAAGRAPARNVSARK